MIYVYHCQECDIHQEIIKSLSHIDDVEKCSKGHVMNRTIAWKGQMKPGDISFKPDYYPSFGKTFTTPGQLKNELKKIKGETGQELVEVGNERMRPVERKSKIDYEAAGRELHQMLRRQRAR